MKNLIQTTFETEIRKFVWQNPAVEKQKEKAPEIAPGQADASLTKLEAKTELKAQKTLVEREAEARKGLTPDEIKKVEEDVEKTMKQPFPEGLKVDSNKLKQVLFVVGLEVAARRKKGETLSSAEEGKFLEQSLAAEGLMSPELKKEIKTEEKNKKLAEKESANVSLLKPKLRQVLNSIDDIGKLVNGAKTVDELKSTLVNKMLEQLDGWIESNQNALAEKSETVDDREYLAQQDEQGQAGMFNMTRIGGAFSAIGGKMFGKDRGIERFPSGTALDLLFKGTEEADYRKRLIESRDDVTALRAEIKGEIEVRTVDLLSGTTFDDLKKEYKTLNPENSLPDAELLLKKLNTVDEYLRDSEYSTKYEAYVNAGGRSDFGVWFEKEKANMSMGQKIGLFFKQIMHWFTGVKGLWQDGEEAKKDSDGERISGLKKSIKDMQTNPEGYAKEKAEAEGKIMGDLRLHLGSKSDGTGNIEYDYLKENYSYLLTRDENGKLFNFIPPFKSLLAPDMEKYWGDYKMTEDDMRRFNDYRDDGPLGQNLFDNKLDAFEPQGKEGFEVNGSDYTSDKKFKTVEDFFKWLSEKEKGDSGSSEKSTS